MSIRRERDQLEWLLRRVTSPEAPRLLALCHSCKECWARGRAGYAKEHKAGLAAANVAEAEVAAVGSVTKLV